VAHAQDNHQWQVFVAGGNVAMTGTRQLINKIQLELKPLHQKIVNHRYLAALETGKVTRETLTVFAVQQHHIIASDLRSIAMLLARHGNLPSRPHLAGRADTLQALSVVSA
jgi:thiaminase